MEYVKNHMWNSISRMFKYNGKQPLEKLEVVNCVLVLRQNMSMQSTPYRGSDFMVLTVCIS